MYLKGAGLPGSVLVQGSLEYGWTAVGIELAPRPMATNSRFPDKVKGIKYLGESVDQNSHHGKRMISGDSAPTLTGRGDILDASYAGNEVAVRYLLSEDSTRVDQRGPYSQGIPGDDVATRASWKPTEASPGHCESCHMMMVHAMLWCQGLVSLAVPKYFYWKVFRQEGFSHAEVSSAQLQCEHLKKAVML